MSFHSFPDSRRRSCGRPSDEGLGSAAGGGAARRAAGRGQRTPTAALQRQAAPRGTSGNGQPQSGSRHQVADATHSTPPWPACMPPAPAACASRHMVGSCRAAAHGPGRLQLPPAVRARLAPCMLPSRGAAAPGWCSRAGAGLPNRHTCRRRACLLVLDALHFGGHQALAAAHGGAVARPRRALHPIQLRPRGRRHRAAHAALGHLLRRRGGGDGRAGLVLAALARPWQDAGRACMPERLTSGATGPTERQAPI